MTGVVGARSGRGKLQLAQWGGPVVSLPTGEGPSEDRALHNGRPETTPYTTAHGSEIGRGDVAPAYGCRRLLPAQHRAVGQIEFHQHDAFALDRVLDDLQPLRVPVIHQNPRDN